MKAAGVDWRAVLMGQWRKDRLWVVDQIQADPALATEAARATYSRHLKKWRRAVGGDREEVRVG